MTDKKITLIAAIISLNSIFAIIAVNIAAAADLNAAIATTGLPDSNKTPGATRVVDVHTLCTTSTKLIRNVPQEEKIAVYREYGLFRNHTGFCRDTSSAYKDEGCEVDHLISLELGGSNDIKNLWPQKYFGLHNAHEKDALENYLHKEICQGKISIPQAQACISNDWIGCKAEMMNH